jgi:hypothetical protein
MKQRENFYRIISTTLSTTQFVHHRWDGRTFVIILLMAKICILMYIVRKAIHFYSTGAFLREEENSSHQLAQLNAN